MNSLLTNPRVFALLSALIVVSGLAALSSLPRDEDPRIGNRHAFVHTVFPGASAERVEALVTEPLEQRLREIPEIQHLDSNSSAGFSSITIELSEQVGMSETDALWARVRDKLEEVRESLPEGSQPPKLENRRTYPFTLIVALQWQHAASEPDLLVLGRYAEELASQLRNLGGIDYIEIIGEPEEEISVNVDAARAALLGLSPQLIGQRVLAADAKVSAGELHNTRLRAALEVEGALDTLARIRAIPLRQLEDGRAVAVGDVAQVARGTRQPAASLAIVNQRAAVVVGVRMLPDQRSDRWSARVQERLDQFAQQLPANVGVEIIFDQEGYTAQRLSNLLGNVVMGFVLIIIVLLFSLGWRSALLVAAALPLTVLFVFAGMHWTGLSINQISVAGLIVALGILVDNAIVMVDSVHRYKAGGMSGLAATRAAVRHLWLPLLSSTLTTILAFMPILLMPGAAGEFVGGIAQTVILSLIGSWLIAHFIVAGLAGRFLPVTGASSNWLAHGVEAKRVSELFVRSLHWSISNPRRVLAIVLSLPLLGFLLSQRLPEQFFPPADRDMINLEVFLPVSASIEQTVDLTKRISGVVADEEGLQSLHWFIGESAPSFYYNLVQGRDNAQYYAQGMVTAQDAQQANRLIKVLQQRLDDRFPEAQIIVRRLEQGPPYNAPVELRVVGPDLAVLRELGDELRRRVLKLDDVVHARSALAESVPKLWLSVNENRARAAQLGLTDVAGQLRNSVEGAVAGSVLEGTEALPVRVRAMGQKAADIEHLQSWLLVPAAPTLQLPLPYSTLGAVAVRPAVGVIPRRDGERINEVGVFIRDGVLPAVVLQRVRSALAAEPLSLPPGYRMEFAGEDEKRDDAVQDLLGSTGVILALLLVTVVMSFNSFRLSGVIVVVALFAAGLGLLALSVSGFPFGFTAIIGLMGLVGLAINAAIIILAELKADAAAVAGERGAVVMAVANCSRHIVSTTVTTAAGFLPLLLASEEFWAPFAVVIAGGTLLTTLVSFYFVPLVFIWLARRQSFELSDDTLVASGTDSV